MSSEEKPDTDDKSMVEKTTPGNQNKKPVLISNGHSKGKSKGATKLSGNGLCKFTDFPNSSAAQLLKTIVIASQAAGQQQQQQQKQQQSTAKLAMQTVEKPLLGDLQSFQGDSFKFLNAGQNDIQSTSTVDHQNSDYLVRQLQGMDGTSVNFQNGINAHLLQEIAKVSNESKALTESLQVNTDHNNGMLGKLGQSDNFSTFEGIKGGLSQQSPEFSIGKNGVLQRLLSGDSAAAGPPRTLGMSSPNISPPNSTANSPYGTDSNFSPFTETTQGSVFMDTDQQKDLSVTLTDSTTQSSLITNTGNLRLDSMAVENGIETESKYGLEWNVTKLDDDLDRVKNGKVPRLHQDSDASSALSPSVDNVFRVEGAQQEVPSDFTFQLFGQGEGEQVFPMVSENDPLPSLDPPVLPNVVDQPFKTPLSVPHSVVKQQRERLRRSKEPILSQPFPAKLHGYELRILQQPEEQHRARYLTEGSRGAVKNRSGTGFPQVKLFGYSGQATLQVFIGNDSGRVRPHGFYQACKVCGKNSTACTEKDIDGTTVIEIELQAANDMTASIDCVGILKLRNADVEQRIGIAKAKKKSTKARMIFRVTFQKPCGSPQVLQVASSTILCTQPIGQPEICKMSLKEASLTGGEELYIIGKNFLRGTRVFFQCVNEDNSDQILWEKEGEIDKDFFQTTHMIVTVPEYTGSAFVGPKISCQVVANSGGKLSDPQPFAYKIVDAANVVIKADISDTVEESRKRNYPFVAPEALELNQQIHQSQQSVSSSSDRFQLPPGILAGMPETDRFTPMEQDTGTGNQLKDPQQSENTINKLEDQASATNNTSMKQNTFGSENLDLSPTQTWDSKDASEIFNVFDKNDSNLDMNGMNFASINSEDYEDHPLDPAYMRIKSPRLSNEGFHSDHNEHVGMGNSTNTQSETQNSLVSQLFQMASMALKHSDPMFSGAETVISKAAIAHSTTVLTTINSRVVMATAADKTHAASSSITTDKTQLMEHSFLKEALTCPPESLAHPNFSKLHSFAESGQSSGFSCESDSAGVSAMQTDVNQTFSGNNQGFNPDQQKAASNTESMELSSESDMNNGTSNTGIPPCNPSTPFSGSVAPNSGNQYPSDVPSPATPYSFGHSPATPFSSAAIQHAPSPVNQFSFGQATQITSQANTYNSVSASPSPATQYSGDTASQIGSSELPFSNSVPESQMHSPVTPFSLAQTSQGGSANTLYSGESASNVANQPSPYSYTESPHPDASPALPPYSMAVSSQILGVSSHMETSPPSYSMHQMATQPASQGMAFSVGDSDLLSSLQINQSLASEMKSIASLLGHHELPHQGLIYHPAHTQTRESASHMKTIMSTIVQNNSAHSGAVQSLSGQPDHHHGPSHLGNPAKCETTASSSGDSNVNAVLKQMLLGLSTQPEAVPQLQQFQPTSQQQMFTQQQQQQFSQQQQQQQQEIQQTIFSLPGGQESSVTVTQANLGQLACSASTPSQNQNSSVPQIIICNNPTSQGQIPSGQFGAPSIVIVPGQNGQGNQVENLLRSILGSMLQSSQEEQQRQQQQPPT